MYIMHVFSRILCIKSDLYIIGESILITYFWKRLLKKLYKQMWISSKQFRNQCAICYIGIIWLSNNFYLMSLHKALIPPKSGHVVSKHYFYILTDFQGLETRVSCNNSNADYSAFLSPFDHFFFRWVKRWSEMLLISFCLSPASAYIGLCVFAAESDITPRTFNVTSPSSHFPLHIRQSSIFMRCCNMIVWALWPK